MERFEILVLTMRWMVGLGRVRQCICKTVVNPRQVDNDTAHKFADVGDMSLLKIRPGESSTE